MADYSISINNLDLSVRTYYCLHRAGLFTVGLIVQKSAEDLLGLPQFSRRCLAELRSKLMERGFPEPWPEYQARSVAPASVDALDIWPRTRRALIARGITSIGHLVRTPGDDLLDFLEWQEVETLRLELMALGLVEPGNIERDGRPRGPR